MKSDKRFFIAVEGYTDSTGSRQYNEELSRKRADAVVNYLVAKHDIPIYRIHMIGLGKEKPAEEGRNRAARAKNRRVEVKVFSADQVTASSQRRQRQSLTGKSSKHFTSGLFAGAVPRAGRPLFAKHNFCLPSARSCAPICRIESLEH